MDGTTKPAPAIQLIKHRLSVGFVFNCGSLVLADFRGLEELVTHHMEHFTGGFESELALVRSIAQLPLNARSLKLMDLWADVMLLFLSHGLVSQILRSHQEN
jgi:hypothetical protein